VATDRLDRNRYATGSTAEFIALAERISGRQLAALFDAWLFTPGKPPSGSLGSEGRQASTER
jgi:aminopeptidase N